MKLQVVRSAADTLARARRLEGTLSQLQERVAAGAVTLAGLEGDPLPSEQLAADLTAAGRDLGQAALELLLMIPDDPGLAMMLADDSFNLGFEAGQLHELNRQKSNLDQGFGKTTSAVAADIGRAREELVSAAFSTAADGNLDWK